MSDDPLTIPVQISKIYEIVQQLHTDMAVLKANGLEGTVIEMRADIREQDDRINELESQVKADRGVIGIVTAAFTAVIVGIVTGGW